MLSTAVTLALVVVLAVAVAVAVVAAPVTGVRKGDKAKTQGKGAEEAEGE
jgi:hypothetical protein